MPLGRFVRQEGDSVLGIARQWNGTELEHYRTRSVDLAPAIARTKQMAEASVPGKSEYQYLGTVSREVINDWLNKQEKTWHDFATDKELKAKFMVYYKNDFSKLMAKTYQERSLKVNRTTAPREGAKILTQYRAENGG